MITETIPVKTGYKYHMNEIRNKAYNYTSCTVHITQTTEVKLESGIL